MCTEERFNVLPNKGITGLRGQIIQYWKGQRKQTGLFRTKRAELIMANF
jgi:hypothetical protein